MAHPKALNDTPDTAQPGQPQTRNPTTPGDLPRVPRRAGCRRLCVGTRDRRRGYGLTQRDPLVWRDVFSAATGTADERRSGRDWTQLRLRATCWRGGHVEGIEELPRYGLPGAGPSARVVTGVQRVDEFGNTVSSESCVGMHTLRERPSSRPCAPDCASGTEACGVGRQR
jgi:hypothetical protein